MEDTPDLSIVIVSYNTRELLLRCLDSVVADQNGLKLELHVVDNASRDGSADEVSRLYPEVNLIKNTENVGFARASNQALEQARGRYIILLNSDTELEEGTLEALTGFMDSHPEAGVVAPKLVYDDGTVQPSIDTFPNLVTEFGHLFNLKKILLTQTLKEKAATKGRLFGRTIATYLKPYDGSSDPVEVDCASGGCLMVRRKAVEQVGLLDENFFMYMEDADWCIRMKRAGFKTYYLPQVSVLHHVGQSAKVDMQAQERAFVERYRGKLYFFKKYRGLLARLLLRKLMIISFSTKWFFLSFRLIGLRSRKDVISRQKMYGQVIGLSLRRCKV